MILHHTQRNCDFFLGVDMEHWNTALATGRQNKLGQWLWLSGLEAFSFPLSLIVAVLHGLPSCIYLLQYNSWLENRWFTRISPLQVRRSCRGRTAKPAVLGRQAWDPPGRRGGTICTSQWLFWISSVPLGGFVQLPWSFYGPCGHNPPKRSPEGKSLAFV